jgi:hypothetical protein
MSELKFPKTGMKLTVEDLLTMDPRGLRSLAWGLMDLKQWFEDAPVRGYGTVKVVGASRRGVDMTLLMSTMRWLSHHVADPKIALSFPDVYRITSIGTSTVTPRGKCIVKPIKPISSWSTHKVINVANRSPSINDALLHIKSPKNVIFSYKVADYIDWPYVLAAYRLLSTANVRNPNPTEQEKWTSFVLSCFLDLNEVMKQYRIEREVVLYHGLHKFRANLVERRSGYLVQEVDKVYLL